jgi:uncharacterized protein YndB with AHSA1/START domain
VKHNRNIQNKKVEKTKSQITMNAKASPNRISVQVVKDFTVTPEKVFDAWLDTGKLNEWMFGPKVRDEQIVKLEAHPYKGGTFSFVVRRDGQLLNHLGTYLEFNRPHRLVFTWGIEAESEDESVVTVEITATGNGCRVTLTHELPEKWADYTESTEAAWSFMLDKLYILFK